MEVIAGWTHAVFPINDASRIGEARRYAAQAIGGMEWDDDDAGRLALVVTELGTNLLHHAQQGRLLIAARTAAAEIEIVAVDDGPGIENLPRYMMDGVSSGSTPGTGLGAVKRLANDFDVHTVVPDGTVCVARIRRGRPDFRYVRPAPLHVGAICVAAPGERECGDAWAVALAPDRVCAIVADGLGHGPEAAKASSAATQAFARHAGEDPGDVVQCVHQALQATRGAAVCVTDWDLAGATLAYAGAGNINGRLLSGVFDKSIVTQHGTAGAQIRRPGVATTDVPRYALVVLHSDGIESRWKPDRLRPVLQRDPTLVAAILWRDHTRHRDDVTVVVLRREE
ncbi:Phosphoserine phosphatase rsbX [plant metagenome]|uniref:Phosphoserine phosphatase rsbX n=1 Tax=plant metagenome TaxID=1297885 RepID=A0A484RD78_9ZZZZ